MGDPNRCVAGGSVQQINKNYGGKASKIRHEFAPLVGLTLYKCSSIYATRSFHFSRGQAEGKEYGDVYVLVVECPWRIETEGQILVGCEDYNIKADDNDDPLWETGMQTGHLQDQKLLELMGEFVHGDIFNTSSNFVVESVEADSVGGFSIIFSGAYCLSVFPASNKEMEWMLRRPPHEYLALMNGELSKSVHGFVGPQ